MPSALIDGVLVSTVAQKCREQPDCFTGIVIRIIGRPTHEQAALTVTQLGDRTDSSTTLIGGHRQNQLCGFVVDGHIPIGILIGHD